MSTSTAPDSALDIEALRARVQDRLDGFLARQTQLLGEVDAELVTLADAVRDLLSGGKRLRAAFAYWGWRGAGGPEDSAGAVSAGAALELLHACALIHDDVMDASDTRRGMPAVHRRFDATHRAAGWVGAPETFGTGAAILLGDLCLVWADELLFAADLPGAALLRAKPLYDLMRAELMAGQYLDLLEQARGGGSVARAMNVVRFKAAKYTVERPLHLGGSLAGAPAELLAAYSAYGVPLGEAFQLRDDVLGVFGDPRQTGKPAGDDIREGKRTVLVAMARDLGTDTQRRLLERHLGDPGLDAAAVEQVREAVVDSGALRQVETLITTLTEQSLAALDAALVGSRAREVLVRLVHEATTRTA